MTADAASELMPPHHGLPVRFAFTFVINALRMGMMFLAGIIMARGLGPGAYGDMNFLLGTFAAAVPLLEMGTSSAFYTMIAQGRRTAAFFRYYAVWLGVQLSVQLLAVTLIFPGSLIRLIWLENDAVSIALALLASFASLQLWPAFQQVGESARETIFVQKLKSGIALLYVLILLSLGWAGRLDVHTALSAMVAAYLLPSVVFLFRFDWGRVLTAAVPPERFAEVFSRYARYCTPLLASSAAGAVYVFADRWLLQYLGGAVQQGYFSVGAQFAAVALLGATSFVNIFWKETAHAHAAGDKDRTERLLMKSVKSLYFSSCAISCFLIPYSGELLSAVFGGDYSPGGVSFAVMLFYPVHQTIGQLTGTYFLATEMTKQYFKVSVLGMVLGIPAAYLLLAPPSAPVPGLGLGAAGLAIKAVLLQIFLVNLQGRIICRGNGWDWPVAHQFLSPLAMLAAGYLCREIPVLILGGQAGFIASISFSAVLFCCISVLLLYRFPRLAGLEPEDVRRYAVSLRRWAVG